ncbi:hypothetical protein BDF19DRAFT_443747 [Syncephalis fuscata]|nr:hypothetical protein BDF19DRAFT_443747 [Syncephalis fuscata]
MSGRRSGGEVDDTAEYNSSDLNDDNDDNDGSHHSSANLSKNKRERIHKPNPMRRAQQQMEEQQRELEAIRQKERMAREQQLKEIAEKKKQRGKARKRMMVKTRTGQPAMAGRIANMLDQLKAEARSE